MKIETYQILKNFEQGILVYTGIGPFHGFILTVSLYEDQMFLYRDGQTRLLCVFSLKHSAITVREDSLTSDEIQMIVNETGFELI